MRGQKGIRILAPIMRFKRKRDEEAEKDITKQNTRVLVGFRNAYVFDVSQTEGAELPAMREMRGSVGENRDRLEQAEERKQQHEQERMEYKAEQERRAEAFREQRERDEQEYEAEQARKEEQRKVRTATFKHILENAPATFTAQLRVLLRAIVTLDSYTFADDLAENITGDNENEQRSAEEVLLYAVDATADDKLTRFALRLALAGHVGIRRKSELDSSPKPRPSSLPYSLRGK